MYTERKRFHPIGEYSSE